MQTVAVGPEKGGSSSDTVSRKSADLQRAKLLPVNVQVQRVKRPFGDHTSFVVIMSITRG